MKHGSLFSGIGGWSEASDQMGWETVFCCEWDESKQYILKHHWPNAEIYGDIEKTNFTKWRGKIYILTASTPCQPFSVAGKREGANDVRHLWPETRRAIREIQPQWFVLENVSGLVNWSKGMVFKQIISDLENEGYEVLPFLLPACGVNAPHKRERIWIVAHTPGNAITGQNRKSFTVKKSGTSVNEPIRGRQLKAVQYERLDDLSRFTSNPSEQGQQNRQSYNGRTDSEENRTGMDNRPERFSIIRTFTNANGQGYKGNKLIRTFEQNGIKPVWESKRQPHKPITELHQTTDWLNFPTVSPLRTGDDGFSRESLRLFINENSGGLLTEKEVNQIIQKSLNKWNNETIAAGGDAVVPGVVYQIFKAIEEYSLINQSCNV